VKKKAQDRVQNKIVQEAQRLGLTLEDKTVVNSFDLLKKYFVTMDGMEAISHMYSCGIGVFEMLLGFNEDTSDHILQEMGWEYDEDTMQIKGKNNLGNRVIMKVVSRIRTNTRRRQVAALLSEWEI
jgi:hypothetical protein